MFLVFYRFVLLESDDLGLFRVCVVTTKDDSDWQLEVIGGLFAVGSGLTIYWASKSFSEGLPS